MRRIEDLLKAGIIACVVVWLAWGPLAVSSLAKITMKPTDEPVKVITIEKGDTLWHLAGKYLNDPRKWKVFLKYNDFTNPNLIYPGEKMQVPLKVAKEMREAMEEELSKLRRSYEAMAEKFEKATAELEKMRKELIRLRTQNRELKESLDRNRRKMDQVRRSMERMSEQMAESRRSAEEMRKSMAQVREASVAQLTDLLNANRELRRKIAAMEEAINSRMAEIADKARELERMREEMGSMSKRIDTLEKGISELNEKIKRAEWPYERPSKNKRLFAFLTALAGAIAWATVSSLAD